MRRERLFIFESHSTAKICLTLYLSCFLSLSPSLTLCLLSSFCLPVHLASPPPPISWAASLLPSLHLSVSLFPFASLSSSFSLHLSFSLLLSISPLSPFFLPLPICLSQILSLYNCLSLFLLQSLSICLCYCLFSVFFCEQANQ